MQTDYPTGYTASDLPFYPGLDDQEFEQFCTDLLNLHPEVVCLRKGKAAIRSIIKADRLLSGTDQGGADIHAVADQGEQWRLQCKHVQKFDDSQVTKAMDLAEKGAPLADQFVLITTCGLSESAQQKIRERPKWDWWGPARLTAWVGSLQPREGAINLVQRFFGPETAKKHFPCSDQPLQTWQEFFARDLSPGGAKFNHCIPWIPQEDKLSRLMAFARSGAGHAIVLSAPGGQGKSRLLLELARRLEQEPQAPRVRFLNLSQRGLTTEQTDFLAREEQELLLVVDDAHRLDAVMEDVVRAAAKAKSVRLLVATRPQAEEALRGQLYRNGYAEKLEKTIQWSRWNAEDIQKLAEQVVAPKHRLHAARLAALADRCPLLVVLGGALINSGSWPEMMQSDEAFRERVFKSFKDDFLSRWPESTRERLGRLIQLLSFVSPAPKAELFYNKAAEILNCSPIAISEDLEALQAAGLLAENREGIRLYPDLFADAVLLEACLDHKGQPSFLHQTILSKLPISDFPAQLRNLAQADWETRSKTGESGRVFEPAWQEFVRRFQAGSWKSEKDWRIELESYLKDGPKQGGPDRAKLLSQWASFAVYLPERTLELASLALQSVTEPATPSSIPMAQAERRSAVSTAIPPLLQPVIIWHPQFAGRAMDILWSLDVEEPQQNLPNSSNAIGVIAEAARFGINKPLRNSETILDWLERELAQNASIKRLRGQPWILSALLKPFFEREVENVWTLDNAVRYRSLTLTSESNRPLRQRALRIVSRFLVSTDLPLAQAVVPVIQTALDPCNGPFGSPASKIVHQAWHTDRTDALRVLGQAISVHKDHPALLLRFRKILSEYSSHDPDENFQIECKRLFLNLPNTFELRVARALGSYVYDEINLEPGPTFDRALTAAGDQWAAFRKSVALEIVDRFKTAAPVCKFISGQVRALLCTDLPVLGGALLEPIAQLSPAWTAALLKELMARQDTTLDGFLWPVLNLSTSHTPEAYFEAVRLIPKQGRLEQIRSLINFFGWKQVHSGGLAQVERESVLKLTEKTDESVVCSLASAVRIYFSNDPKWALEVLSRIKPQGERSEDEIVSALEHLAKAHGSVLGPEKIGKCLAKLGALWLSQSLSSRHTLHSVAKAFPKQFYEYLRDLFECEENRLRIFQGRHLLKVLSLGPIGDADYVDREISTLWTKALSCKENKPAQGFHLALLGALIWSAPATAPQRIGKLIAGSLDGEQLKLTAELVTARGSYFVFQFPDLVRAFLLRGEILGVIPQIERLLWLSACGGGRSYTDHELDPEYRYILEQGESLANRYRDDVHLNPFYRMVADSERQQAEWNRKAFATENASD